MKKKPTPSNTEKSTPFVEPSYFKELGIVWTNDKVGQTFVTTLKKPLPKKKDAKPRKTDL
jgi:hypothetical protein